MTRHDWSGQSVLVTGAGRGLGQAIALDLAARGANLTIVSRTVANLTTTSNLIDDLAQGGRVVAVAADVGTANGAQAAVALAQRTYGRLDLVINNAGVLAPVKPLWEADPADWLGNITANLGSVFLVCRAALPGMIARKEGAILNISSGAAVGVRTSWSAYCAAKAGIDHLTRVLAAEVAPYNIQVNAAYPGIVDTPMQAEIRATPAADFGAENLALFTSFHEEGKLRQPAQVARFIAKVAAASQSGQIFKIDDFKEED